MDRDTEERLERAFELAAEDHRAALAADWNRAAASAGGPA